MKLYEWQFCQNFGIFRVINFSFIVTNFAKYARGWQAETNFLYPGATCMVATVLVKEKYKIKKKEHDKRT
jgi:hypothetical protein